MSPDQILHRIAYGKVQQQTVFKTLYKTIEGSWSEEIDEGDWHRWQGLPKGAWCCDVKHDYFFLVGKKRFNDLHEAVSEMEFEILKPYLLHLLLVVAKAMKRTKRIQLQRG